MLIEMMLLSEVNCHRLSLKSARTRHALCK